MGVEGIHSFLFILLSMGAQNAPEVGANYRNWSETAGLGPSWVKIR